MIQIELLSNFDLLDICKELNINIIQVDSKININIPPTKDKLCCYIVNLDNTAGTHWCCFVVYNNNAFYFNPYGVIYPIEIKNFIQRNDIKMNYNQIQIQALESSGCGYYCIGFLFYATKYYNKFQNFQKINNIYTKNFNTEIQDKNDFILQKIIKNIISH